MPVRVFEYLGQRTDAEANIVPTTTESAPCPFMDHDCAKLPKGDKPICSVKDSNDTMWIVCEHRLCATKSTNSLTQYQKNILHSIAQAIFYDSVSPDDVYVRKEVRMPLAGRQFVRADYVMVHHGKSRGQGPARVVLEMQGGGETSNTGTITRHVKQWEGLNSPTNEFLSDRLTGPGPIVTNAWRRQQEQFLIKGNIVVQTGGGIVFCVGSLLYDFVMKKVEGHTFPELRNHAWTLAMIGIVDDNSSEPHQGPVPLKLDEDRMFFTNYHNFVEVLIRQGGPYPELFQGELNNLSGDPRNFT